MWQKQATSLDIKKKECFNFLEKSCWEHFKHALPPFHVIDELSVIEIINGKNDLQGFMDDTSRPWRSCSVVV